MQRITGLINQLSFSRKLAFTFFMCSLLTFIIINIIMHVLYSTVVTSGNTSNAFNTEAFCEFSNSEIISSAESYINSGVDIYEEIVTEVYSVYEHFSTNPTLYTSRERKGVNPPLASTFTQPRYDRSCMYFFTNTSTFYNQPYIDKIIASSATSHYPSRLHRLNVFYQSKTDPNDISVRTMPATNDFYIPNSAAISSRIAGLEEGVIQDTDIYTDQLSLSNNETKLIALRLLIPTNGKANILIEAEIKSDILNTALSSIISFPSTKVALVKVLSPTKYSILGQSPDMYSSVELGQYLQDGSKNVTIEGSQFLVTTRAFVDHNNDVHKNSSEVDTSIVTDNLLILFLNKSEGELPNIAYHEFLDREYTILVYILYGWTIIVLLIIFAIGFVVGDIIFSYFSLIRKKSKQYLHNPEQLKKIDEEMRGSFKNQRRNQYLSENILGIMQGIETKKKQNRKNYKISYDVYPLNRLGMNFQNKMRIKDYHRFEYVAGIIKERQEFLN